MSHVLRLSKKNIPAGLTQANIATMGRTSLNCLIIKLIGRMLLTMTILVKFLTVVVRIESIEMKYPGGIDGYMKDHLIQRDRNLTGKVFMSTGESWEFIEKLVNLGFGYDEIALVDQSIGLFSPCTWLETSITGYFDSEGKESTCWFKEIVEDNPKTKREAIASQINLTPAQMIEKMKQAFPNSEVRLSREGDPELSGIYINFYPGSTKPKKNTAPKKSEEKTKKETGKQS